MIREQAQILALEDILDPIVDTLIASVPHLKIAAARRLWSNVVRTNSCVWTLWASGADASGAPYHFWLTPFHVAKIGPSPPDWVGSPSSRVIVNIYDDWMIIPTDLELLRNLPASYPPVTAREWTEAVPRGTASDWFDAAAERLRAGDDVTVYAAPRRFLSYGGGGSSAQARDVIPLRLTSASTCDSS